MIGVKSSWILKASKYMDMKELVREGYLSVIQTD